MALADHIKVLRDQALDSLNAAHDYYSDTKIAWKLVIEVVEEGKTFENKNTATGTLTTAAELAGKVPRYVTKHVAEATFQQFLSIFENFVFDLLGLWLAANPRRVCIFYLGDFTRRRGGVGTRSRPKVGPR